MSCRGFDKAQQDYDSRVPESVEADQECERCGVQSFSHEGELCIVAIPDMGSEGCEGSETHLEICQGCLDLLHAWFCPEQAIAQGLDDSLPEVFDFETEGIYRNGEVLAGRVQIIEGLARARVTSAPSDLTDEQIAYHFGADVLADLKAQIEIDNERAER